MEPFVPSPCLYTTVPRRGANSLRCLHKYLKLDRDAPRLKKRRHLGSNWGTAQCMSVGFSQAQGSHPGGTQPPHTTYVDEELID